QRRAVDLSYEPVSVSPGARAAVSAGSVETMGVAGTDGGSVGGGLCSRSITDFATSAADLMVSGDLRARGFGVGRETGRAAFAADAGLRTLGLAAAVLATAAGLTSPGAAAAAAASTFLRACLAA